SNNVTLCIEVTDTNAIVAEALIANWLDFYGVADRRWVRWRFKSRFLRSCALERDAVFVNKQVLMVGARTHTYCGPGRRAIDCGLNGVSGCHLNGARRPRGPLSCPGADESYEDSRKKSAALSC